MTANYIFNTIHESKSDLISAEPAESAVGRAMGMGPSGQGGDGQPMGRKKRQIETATCTNTDSE